MRRWAQAAKIASRATGKPLQVKRITDQATHDVLRDVGMINGLGDAVIGMSVGLRDGFVPEQLRTVQTTVQRRSPPGRTTLCASRSDPARAHRVAAHLERASATRASLSTVPYLRISD